MTNEELKQSLERILNDAVTLQVYFILKSQNNITIKLADIDNGRTLRDLRSLYVNKIEEDIIRNEQLSILELSATDERVNAIYHYDLNEVPDELEPFYNFSLQNTYQTFSFEHDDLKDINGFIIFLGTRDNNVILFKKHYPICLIKRDSFLMFKRDERFVEMDEDLIRLSSEFQFIKLGNDLFIKDLSVLEKFFGFHEIIKREALLAIDQIENINLLEDMDVLREAIDDVTFARKLTKVRNASPVLTMNIPNEQIINFTKTTPGLAGKFKYSDNDTKIRLDTKKSKEAFVKLLNDDFLKSELTQLYYDSLDKDKLPTT
ncbi:MAG: hypothetical protein JG777_3166 [Clostridia bacterium]|jgi:hypothetical protein|nr:hypothetical protein [Clostridia bacterium]